MPSIDVPVIPHPSKHSRMDERKRPSAFDGDDSAPPTKKQATNTANGSAKTHQDIDLPGKDDLERFQKEAIFRQMQEYKREKITLENQYTDLKKRSAYHDDHLRILSSWFDQLLDEVKLLSGDVNGGTPFAPFPSALLTAPSEDVQKHLTEKSLFIQAAVKEVFGKASTQEPAVADLQNRIAGLLGLEKQHSNELEKTRLEKEQLEERLETASMRYMVAEKKLDRVKSTTVAKLERQAIAGGRSEIGSGLGGGNEVKKEGINGQIDSEALALAETGRKEALAIAAKQEQQVKDLAEANQSLAERLTAEKSKALGGDEDYAQSDLFKHAKKQLEDFINRINSLEALNNELRTEAKRLQAERAAYRSEVDAEMQASMTEKDLHLTKAESDLARIRAARDELYAELQIKKQSQDGNKASIEQIKNMTIAKDERIKALEAEIERLKTDSVEASQEIAELSLEELQLRYAKLEKQYSMMDSEIAALSIAYKKLTSTASLKTANLAELEDKVARSAAEKAKADQKYFGAMKAKEVREQEVRALRAQNSKSAEMVSQFKEAEASSRQLIVALEKQVADLKEAYSTLESKYRISQAKIQEKATEVESAAKPLAELRLLIQGKDKELAASASSLRKLEIEVEKLQVNLEAKTKQLETWRQTSAQGDDGRINDVLRDRAYCHICRTSLKDHAIKSCGHVFCKACIDKVYENRSRKCPNCNKAFSLADVMKITL